MVESYQINTRMGGALMQGEKVITSALASLRQPKPIFGFTLVEIAVALLIGAIILTAGLSLVRTRLEAAQIDVTQKHQEAIKQALISYLARNKRLPCPDVIDAVTGNPNSRDGREDRIGGGPPWNCATPPVGAPYVGGVPYVDLGLERSAALDGWDNYITYVMSPNWQLTYGDGVAVNTSNVIPNPAAFNALAAFVPKVTMGAIAVYGNQMPTLVLNACTSFQAGVAPNTGATVALSRNTS